MAVYVDNMQAPFGRLIMCHMVADTTEELNAMADAINLPRRFIQAPGTYREHYDLGLVKRAHAVRLGAKEVTRMELGAIIRAKSCGTL